VGVVEAEARMAAGEWSTATATIGKGESTQERAVLWANRGHGYLLRVEFWDLDRKRAQAGLPVPQKKSLAEARRNSIQKTLYRSGNKFVKQKMWNCPTLATLGRAFVD
jgi:hypothetical protein